MSQFHFSHAGRLYHFKLERQDGVVTIHLPQEGANPMVARGDVEFRDPWILLRVDGRTHRVLATRDGSGVWVTLAGRTWYLKQERSAVAQTASADHHAEVRAPMTGTVIKVLAEPGARVSAGDLLAVMEAMKMEYRLEARSAGQVHRVHCRPGDLLNVGALLVELEAEPVG